MAPAPTLQAQSRIKGNGPRLQIIRHGPRWWGWYSAPFSMVPAVRWVPDHGQIRPDKGQAAPRRAGAVLVQSIRVDTRRSPPKCGWRGFSPEQATPGALGIEQAGPKKLGKGPGRRTGRTKSPGITLARQQKSWGNTPLIVMVGGVFLCPPDPKIARP